MSTVLQIILSIILFGLFILIVIGVENNVTSYAHQTTFDKNSQTSIVELAQLIDHDFPKIGHMKQKPRFKPGQLDSNRIVWYSDYDNNGTVDSIYYYTGDRLGSNSPNPNIRYIFRKINNGNPLKVGLGIVYFNISYYDSAMTQINYSQLSQLSNINKIRAIKVRLRAESQYKVSDKFSSAFWEKTYFPRSLKF